VRERNEMKLRRREKEKYLKEELGIYKGDTSRSDYCTHSRMKQGRLEDRSKVTL